MARAGQTPLPPPPAPDSSAPALPAASDRLPTVAIVGRPNGGQSTLFNRLVRAQRAIVDSRPGVTRDRNEALARWDDRSFRLIDTGGLDDSDASALATAVRAHGARAAAEADVVIAVLDGRAGLNPADRDVVDSVRRLRKPVIYAVNKIDTPAHDAAAVEFFALGLPEIVPISSAHGYGIADLMERVIACFPDGDASSVQRNA